MLYSVQAHTAVRSTRRFVQHEAHRNGIPELAAVASQMTSKIALFDEAKLAIQGPGGAPIKPTTAVQSKPNLVREIGRSPNEDRFVNRDLALFLAALRQGLDVLLQQPAATDACSIDSNGGDESRELDDEDIRYLASIAYQVNERVIDEIRGGTPFNGVLLGAIFAIFLLLVDKVESFTFGRF